MASKDNHEERDLELMFAEARRYDLLTAEQEREIDGRKWRAVQALQQLFVEEKELLDYCTRFIAQCSSSPPEIKRFHQQRPTLRLASGNSPPTSTTGSSPRQPRGSHRKAAS